MANKKVKIVLKILFFKLSNADMLFDHKIFIWRFYIANKASVTSKKVQIINSKEFVIVVLNIDSEMFIIFMIINI